MDRLYQWTKRKLIQSQLYIISLKKQSGLSKGGSEIPTKEDNTMDENTNVQIITFFPLNQGMPPQLINNISVTAKCCRERHIGLNENTLRFLCRTGQIPCIKVGNKTLINWNVLMEFLMSGGVKAEQPEPEAPVPVAAADGIRKVPARIKR